MKLRLFAVLATLAALLSCQQNNSPAPAELTPEEAIAADPYKAGGVYFRGKEYSLANVDGKPAPGNEKTALTPAPKGYKAFHISHYGRHGARYILDPKDNERVVKPMRAALADSALTPFGEDLARRILAHYETTRHREADLSRLGWKQHQDIARTMYEDYPSIFRHNPSIEAYATQIPRCIMSMDAFCTQLTAIDPKLDIYQETSRANLNNLNPHARENPFNTRAPDPSGRSRVNPWGGTWKEFVDSTLDWRAILGRIFKDPCWIDSWREPRHFVTKDLFDFIFSAQDSDSGIDMLDAFTPEEIFQLWEVDNYVFWVLSGPCNNRDLVLLENYLLFADEALESYDGRPSVLLRFGHDNVLLFMLAAFGVDGMGEMPENAADIKNHWQTYKVPMGAVLNTVFYRPVRGSGDILVKVTLNDEEAELPLEPVQGPYYKWEDLKAHLQNFIDERRD